MKTFLRAMGSELEKEIVRNAAAKFDFLHTGEYGYRMLEKYAPELRSKAIVWFNPFAHHRYGGKEGDIQPTPRAVGHDLMPLQWGAPGQTACAYDWTEDNWPGEFILAVSKWRGLNPWAKVLFDDWRLDHPWWEENGMHWVDYIKTIPVGPKLDNVSELLTAGDFANGAYPSRAARFWEMTGRSMWHTLEVFRKAKPGDHIYCTVPRYYSAAKAIASLRKCAVGLGLPDGESMTDEEGTLKVWVPTQRRR